MLAFAKAVNLNSESQIQRSLAKALRAVLESYFSSKICNKTISEVVDSPNTGDDIQSILFTEDERHAVQALVRSYISDISFQPTKKLIRSINAEQSPSPDSPQVDDKVESILEQDSSIIPDDSIFLPETINGTEMLTQNQIFGKHPSFVNFILSVDMPGGSITPSSTSFSPTMFSNQDSMESYIRLLVSSSKCYEKVSNT